MNIEGSVCNLAHGCDKWQRDGKILEIHAIDKVYMIHRYVFVKCLNLLAKVHKIHTHDGGTDNVIHNKSPY